MKKKVIGIISGMGTKSGLLFVDKLSKNVNAIKDQDFPEFILHNNSRVPDRTRAIVYGEESPLEELKRSVDILNKCNVDIIISCCNTSYFYLRNMTIPENIRLINPISLTVAEIRKKYKSANRIGLLASSGTIFSRLFHDEFENTPLELFTLEKEVQEDKFMKALYMPGGLKSSPISDHAYELFNYSLDAILKKNIDLLIGGCSEVQIGINNTTVEIPYLDTMDIMLNVVLEEINQTGLLSSN